MSRLRSLQDFIAAGLDTIVKCQGCGRLVRADPRKLLAGISAKWRHDLGYQGSKLRCSACHQRGARIAPAPKIAGPLDCPDFRADLEAMWERVMAEQNDPPFKIEGPDADGFVWICSSEGREVWCHNLGTQEQAAEQFSQWLGAIDYLENS